MKKNLSFALFLAFFLNSYHGFSQTELWQKEILQKVNDLRKSGCKCDRKNYPPVPALKWSKNLESSSTLHAIEMFKNNYFDHTSKNGDSYADRITNSGFDWMFCGENIATGQKNVAEVFEAWKKSPTHCKNMMSKDFKEMGVAEVKKYWVQDFGTLMKK